MFFKKKTDPIKAHYEDRTYTIEEIRANYVPMTQYRRTSLQLIMTDFAGTILILIALCVGYALGVSSGVTGTEIARQSNAAIEEAVSEEVAENLGDK